MAALYQKYLADGPLAYMEILFAGITGHAGDARQLALDFYQSWRKAPAFRHGDISHISFVFCIF